MDKLMDSRWFMKIIALFLALLLFSTVNFESQNKDGASGGPISSKQTSETIPDVPVVVIYDEENLVVTGVPETVSVLIEGPNALVQTAKALKNFEVYVDLSDAQIGKKRVPIQIRDISDKLKVSIEPAYANVSIQERVTKEFKVEAEFNRTIIEEGYFAEQPIVEPNKVTITGAKDVIEKISYVKATIDDRGTINRTITRESSVRVLDRELNKLNVIVEPKTVQVTLPVKSSSKIVPIHIVQKGTLPKGFKLDAITLDYPEATIFAEEEVLNKTDHVRVEVDLSNIKGNTETSLPIIIPQGIVKVEPKMVNARIRVKQEEKEITLEKIPIKNKGLAEKYQLIFLDPSNGHINLTVFGPSETVKKLSAADFEVSVDTSNLGEGEHDIKLNVVGPKNISWKIAKEHVKVNILKNEEV